MHDCIWLMFCKGNNQVYTIRVQVQNTSSHKITDKYTIKP